MKVFCTVIFSAVLLSGQVRSVGIKPTAPAPADEAGEKRNALAGPPVLGYVVGPGPADVHAILGASRKPQLGAPLTLPPGANRLYLPPRQNYALLETASGDSVAVWAMLRAAIGSATQEPVAVKGAMAHPDLVAFSPLGGAFVLYSQSDGSVQVVTNVPAQPAVSRQLSLSNLGTPSRMAISDDAELVVAQLADGSVSSSWHGAAWIPLAAGFTPKAWSFIPNSHDLAMSDTTQNMIVLLPNVNALSKGVRVLAQGVQADQIALTKSGDELVGANSVSGQVWTIDLKTGTVTPRDEVLRAGTMSLLRDGFTFLLSTSPSLGMLKLGLTPDLRDAVHSEIAGPVLPATVNR